MIELIKRLAEWLKGSRFSKNRAGKFVLEVLIEMVGVTWPSKDEVVSSTVVVLVTLVLVAAFLYGVNLFVGQALDGLGRLIASVFA